MSAYATVDDVRAAVNPDWRPGSPEPDAAAQDASSLTDAQLSDAIAQASGKIDSWIGGQYQTPVVAATPGDPATIPDQQVRYWTRDIAAWYATLTFRRGEPMEATDPVQLRMAAAMTDLAAVRDGRALLNLPPATDGDAEAATGFSGVIGGVSGLFDTGDAGFHSAGAFGGIRQWTEDAPRWVGHG